MSTIYQAAMMTVTKCLATLIKYKGKGANGRTSRSDGTMLTQRSRRPTFSRLQQLQGGCLWQERIESVCGCTMQAISYPQLLNSRSAVSRCRRQDHRQACHR